MTDTMSSKCSILIFAGSTRRGALSGKLAAAAAAELLELGCNVEVISLGDFPMPIYNADIQADEGFPEGAKGLAQKFAAHQGVLIVTPEHNQSLSSLLKNAIDWLSRFRGDALKPMLDKPYAVLSSSSGQIGGARALIDLRKVLVSAFSSLVIPQQMSLPNAEQAFLPSGEIAKENQQKQLRGVCEALAAMARVMSDLR